MFHDNNDATDDDKNLPVVEQPRKN